MKNFRFSRILLFAVFALFALSCGDKKKKPAESVVTDTFRYKKLPDSLSKDFKKAFKKDFYSIVKDSVFVIGKDNYLDIINKAPDDATQVVFQFMEMKGDIEKKYPELKAFKNRIYAAYYYENSAKDKDYYAAIGVAKTIVLSKDFVDEMSQNYNDNMRKKLDPFAKNKSHTNTMKVKMTYDFFKNYVALFPTYPDLKEIHLAFGKITDIKPFVKSQRDGLFADQNYVKFILRITDNEGQLMFITGGSNTDGSQPADIGGYDYNHFCPNDCP